MNEERKIAQTILDTQKMREESYVSNIFADGSDYGEYKRSIEECLIKAGKKNGLSPNLWALLSLAMLWWDDIQLWAEDILAGKDIETGKLDEVSKNVEKDSK